MKPPIHEENYEHWKQDMLWPKNELNNLIEYELNTLQEKENLYNTFVKRIVK